MKSNIKCKNMKDIKMYQLNMLKNYALKFSFIIFYFFLLHNLTFLFIICCKRNLMICTKLLCLHFTKYLLVHLLLHNSRKTNVLATKVSRVTSRTPKHFKYLVRGFDNIMIMLNWTLTWYVKLAKLNLYIFF